MIHPDLLKSILRSASLWVIIILIVMVFAEAKAEGLYLTVGAGWNETLTSSSSEWNDANSTGAFIAVYYKWDRQWWCKCAPSLNYAHISQYESGSPWNNEDESTIDHIGIAATWVIFER